MTETVGEFGSSSKKDKIISVRPSIINGNALYTEEELNQISKFFYIYSIIKQKLDSYAERLGNSEKIGVATMPTLSKEIKNVGFVTFLAVNPQTANLDVTLGYVSDFCKYMMTRKDSFLFPAFDGRPAWQA